MSEPAASYTNMGNAEDCAVDNIGGFLQAVSKARQLGLFNNHPDRPEITNKEVILLEAEDVVHAITRYTRQLMDIQPAPTPEAG